MTDETVAYQRPTRQPWKHRVENALNRAYDIHMAINDILPAIAAVTFFIWLLNTVGPR